MERVIERNASYCSQIVLDPSGWTAVPERPTVSSLGLTYEVSSPSSVLDPYVEMCFDGRGLGAQPGHLSSGDLVLCTLEFVHQSEEQFGTSRWNV